MSHAVAELAVNGALPVSIKHRIDFTPDRYKTEDSEAGEKQAKAGAPTYTLRAQTLAERQHVWFTVLEETGATLDPEEVRASIREAAALYCDEDDAATVAGLLDELESLDTAEGEDAIARRDEVAGLVAKHELVLSRSHKPLSKLLVHNQRQMAALNRYTVRACIVDWENLSAPCKRKGGFVTDDSMAVVPDEDYAALVTRCRELREVSRDLDRGSVSP